MNVLHVATLNRPIRQDLGYGPIETVVYNLDKGLHELGCRSIVACSGDSQVVGEHFPTIEHSFSEYCTDHYTCEAGTHAPTPGYLTSTSATG